MTIQNINSDASQEQLQDTLVFEDTGNSEIIDTVQGGDVMKGGIPDVSGEKRETCQGVYITNYIPYQKIILSENPEEIIFEDNEHDTVELKNKKIIKNGYNNIVDSSSNIDFGSGTDKEDIDAPLEFEEETFTLVIPDKEVPMIDESKEGDAVPDEYIDKDIKSILESVQHEITNSVPVSVVDGRIQINEAVVDSIKKKVDIAGRLYIKKFALRNVSFALRNLKKLAKGIQVQKGDRVYSVPPSESANLKLLDFIKDETLLKIDTGSGRKMTLSEVLESRANGDKRTTKTISVSQ